MHLFRFYFKKCFIERSARAARKADIVIANHALVLNQAAVDYALGVAETEEEEAAPGGLRRIVFDEGHHLFDAADWLFPGISRRWKQRNSGAGCAALNWNGGAGAVWWTASAIWWPTMKRRKNWCRRFCRQLMPCRDRAGRGGCRQERRKAWPNISSPLARQQVLARAEMNAGNSIETDCVPLVDGLAEAAEDLATALHDLKRPMTKLAEALGQEA